MGREKLFGNREVGGDGGHIHTFYLRPAPNSSDSVVGMGEATVNERHNGLIAVYNRLCFLGDGYQQNK